MSSFYSVGVDAAGNVFPATIQWPASTAAPTIDQTAAASGAGQNITIAPQAGVSGVSGSLVVNVSAPGSGTTEAGIFLKRVGTTLFSVAASTSFSTWVQLNVGAFPILCEGLSGSPTTQIGNGPINFVTSAGATTLALGATAAWSVPHGGLSTTPYAFVNSAVTLLTSGNTPLSSAQQLCPNLTLAAVTLTGAAVLDFGNVTGNFQVNILGVNAASFASFGLSLKNGTTTTALPSTALTNGGLVIVRCDTNAIAFCA